MRVVLVLVVAFCVGGAHAADDVDDELGLRGRARIEAREEQVNSTIFRRPGERRPDEQRSYDLFGRTLTVGGEYEFRGALEGDFGFDDRRDDELNLDQKLELEIAYWLSERAILFLEGSYFFRADTLREDHKETSIGSFERGEMWLYLSNLFESPFSMQVGRQRFSDAREWFWDEDFDAFRLHADGETFHAEIALAERMARHSTDEDRTDPRRKGLRVLLASATWEWARRQRLEFFVASQRDRSSTEVVGQFIDPDREDTSDADLTWFGAALRGKRTVSGIGKLRYWIDLASVRGDEEFLDFDTVPLGRITDDVTVHAVRGWAADLGISWRTELPGTPTFTLGFAEGSGDRGMTDKTDSGFRQTGFQDNNARWSGVDRFRYYGELLEPELSNLRITTLAVGLPLLHSSSVEVLYHTYHQVHAAPFLRDTNLKLVPDGRRRRIGQELDVVLGLEEWNHLELEAVGSLFRAGTAFGRNSGERSYYGALKINWNY